MSKKHFVALADTIKRGNSYAAGTLFSETAIHMLADFCQSENSNFKRDRWLSYIAGECGKNGGQVKK